MHRDRSWATLKLIKGSRQIHLDAVLKSFSSHLDGLAQQINDVEDALSITIEGKNPSNVAPIQKLQSLDYIRQSLEDSALMVHLLSQLELVHGLKINDAGAIAVKFKLEKTQELLLLCENPSLHMTKSSGDLDLF